MNVTISRDEFLAPLRLHALSEMLPDKFSRDYAYEVVVGFLTARDLVETIPRGEDAGALGSLPLKIPGLPLSVRLGGFSERDQQAVLLVLAYFLGKEQPPPPAEVAVGALVLLAQRIRRLRPEYGELSVIDAIRVAAPATVENITVALFGKRCPHAHANCRFMVPDTKTCAISREQVALTAESLVEKDVLMHLTSTPSLEYSVRV